MKVHAYLLSLALLGAILPACNSAEPPSVAPTLTLTAPSGQATQPSLIPITVYFTDTARYEVGTPPFEAGVTRLVEPGVSLPEAALHEFFRGPTPQERASGLERITSGFTRFGSLVIEDGIARVYLIGPCASNGATYTIAAPLLANLTQFPEIKVVKIYDAEGTTEVPDGLQNSIPFCLEP